MVLAHHLFEIVQSYRQKKKLLGLDTNIDININTNIDTITNKNTNINELISSSISDCTSPEINDIDQSNQFNEMNVIDGSISTSPSNSIKSIEISIENNNLSIIEELKNQENHENHDKLEIDTTSITPSEISVGSLRAMFEARDVALNKLIESTSLLNSESLNKEIKNSNDKIENKNKETVRCISCQELICCTFPPLQSAAAKYRREKLSNINEESVIELEPKYTNWTSDYIG